MRLFNWTTWVTIVACVLLTQTPMDDAKPIKSVNPISIEQCKPDHHLQTQEEHTRFEVLYDNVQSSIYLIANKNGVYKNGNATSNSTQHVFTVKCRPSYMPQFVNLDVIVDDTTGNLIHLEINRTPVDITKSRIETNERSVYFVRFNMTTNNELDDQAPIVQYDSPVQDDQRMSFVEKHLIKQDKLNNTIWIYEELRLNTTIAYLTVDQYAHTRVIITNRGDIEFTSTDMSFQLVRILNVNDGSSGSLYALKVNKRIDREQVDHFDLTFSVDQDNREIKLRVCLIDINDNVPRFVDTNVTSHLYENRLYANFVQIRALDDDIGRNGHLTYDLLATNANATTDRLFHINRNNGFLSLNVKLDREVCGLYTVNVRVCDTGDLQRLCNQTSVVVNVLDENDNGPMFNTKGPDAYSFKIRQQKPINTYVANMEAFDPDVDPQTTYTFVPESMGHVFGIDARTGRLFAKMVFNWTQAYAFTVFATDAGRVDLPGDSVNVTVHVVAITEQDPFIEHTIDNRTLVTLDLAIFNASRMNSSTGGRVELVVLPPSLSSSYDFLFIKRTSMRFLSQINPNNSIVATNHNGTADLYRNNLTDIFSIDPNGTLSLTRTNPWHLNMGLYNFSIGNRPDENNSKPHDNTNIRLFVYNSTAQPNMSLEDLCDLDKSVDLWFQRNLREYWLADYENKYSMGLYAIDLDYYENLTMIDVGLLNTSYLMLNQFADSFFFNSNMIIVLICLFLFIAILLVVIITYKHNKVSLVTDETSPSHFDKPDGKTLVKCMQAHKPSNEVQPISRLDGSSKSASISSTSSNKLLFSTITASSTTTTSIKSLTTNHEQETSAKAIAGLEDFDNLDVKLANTNEVHLFEIKQKSDTNRLDAHATGTECNDFGKIRKHIKFEDDFGYYGSSDYSSDTTSIMNKRLSRQISYANDQAKMSNEHQSPTSSTEYSTSEPTVSTTTTASSCATISTYDDYKNFIMRTRENDNLNKKNLKLYFERFERMYNSRDATNQDIYNNRHSIVSAYSYV